MKTYSTNINKLYESTAGFELLVKGSSYTSKKGNKYTITDIVIDAKTMQPSVVVSYEFETEDGQKGNEDNAVDIFVDMLRNS